MIRHHVPPETLLRHAAGTLPAGLAVVVGAHLEVCPECRAETGRLEAVGGALLEDLPPEPLQDTAFNQVLARLDEPAPAPAPSPALPAGLPAALRGARFGRWLPIGPGIRYRRIRLPWAPAQRMMMFRVAGGRGVIHHSHRGAEFTQLLAGGFTDCTGHYAVGDFAETDQTLAHRPVADPEGCLCLAALESGLRLPWLDRLLRRRP